MGCQSPSVLRTGLSLPKRALYPARATWQDRAFLEKLVWSFFRKMAL